jgi:hypothetical protein
VFGKRAANFRIADATANTARDRGHGCGNDMEKVPVPADKSAIVPPASKRGSEQLALPQSIRVRAPGLRSELATVEGSIKFIDKNVPRELARLPRWTFARALLAEALATRKSRDLRVAVRQLTQALSNEHWLEVERVS